MRTSDSQNPTSSILTLFFHTPSIQRNQIQLTGCMPRLSTDCKTCTNACVQKIWTEVSQKLVQYTKVGHPVTTAPQMIGYKWWSFHYASLPEGGTILFVLLPDWSRWAPQQKQTVYWWKNMCYFSDTENGTGNKNKCYIMLLFLKGIWIWFLFDNFSFSASCNEG